MKKATAFAALCLLFAPAAFAAERLSPVEVTARVLKSRIKIGDEVRLLVQVDRPRKYTVTPPSPKTDLSPFEIKEVDASPTVRGQNRVQETYGLTLTVFEVGELKVPPLTIRYQDESGGPGEIRTEPVPVTVVSVGKKLTDKDDIRPIKGPVSTGLLRFRTWILGILAGGLFVVLVVRLVRAWMKRDRDLESKKPPYERARLELARLKDRGLLEEQKVKEYYTGLADILRNYMDRTWKFQTREQTAAEVLELLKKNGFEKIAVDKAKSVLEETDLVKFAKRVPERALADRLEAEILEFTELTKPAEAPKK